MKHSVPIKIVALLLNCVVFVCFSAFLAADEAVNGTSSKDEVGKLYVLNVWGTDAEDYSTFLACMANQFGRTMESSGLSPLSEKFDDVANKAVKINFCVEYTTLLGKEAYESIKAVRDFLSKNGVVKDYTNLPVGYASNKNVLETCQDISQKAGKNDVIFVYMCCHAKTAKLDGDNKRYHILFPGITKLSEMDNNENGIKRSDIIKALNPDKHRLVVLITDSSACPSDSPVLFPAPITPSSEWPFHNNRLWQLLQTNTGLIDWNSASPFGGYDKQGELASFFQCESIFNESFYYAIEEIDPEISSISTSDFFKGLKEKLATKFEYCQKNDKTEYGVEIIKTGCSAFDNQPTQTLFDFKGLGYVIDNYEKETDIDNNVKNKQ